MEAIGEHSGLSEALNEVGSMRKRPYTQPMCQRPPHVNAYGLRAFKKLIKKSYINEESISRLL